VAGTKAIVKIKPSQQHVLRAYAERYRKPTMDTVIVMSTRREGPKLGLGTLKKIITERRYLIIPEMGMRLSGVFGRYLWVMPARRIVLWSFGSKRLYELLQTLMGRGEVVPVVAPQLIFFRHRYPELPVARGLETHDDLHWLPLAFEDASRVEMTEADADFLSRVFGSGSPHLEVIESTQRRSSS